MLTWIGCIAAHHRASSRHRVLYRTSHVNVLWIFPASNCIHSLSIVCFRNLFFALTLWRSRSRKSSSPFCAANRPFLNVLNKSLIVNVSPSRRRLWSLPPDSSILSRLRPSFRSLRASRSSSDILSLFRSLVLRPRAFFTLSTSSSTFCNGVRLIWIGRK